jgi:hypothetical protein
MSKKSEVELKRLMAVDFARQITKLTEPKVFEKALKAVQQNKMDDFKKICDGLDINPKVADQMWSDFSEWKDSEISVGWTSGWTSG